MKIKLTLRYVLSMIMVFYITMIVYTILNIVIYKGNFSFGEEVFNLSFSTRDFALEYVKDLEEDNDLRLSDENIDKLIPFLMTSPVSSFIQMFPKIYIFLLVSVFIIPLFS